MDKERRREGGELGRAARLLATLLLCHIEGRPLALGKVDQLADGLAPRLRRRRVERAQDNRDLSVEREAGKEPQLTGGSALKPDGHHLGSAALREHTGKKLHDVARLHEAKTRELGVVVSGKRGHRGLGVRQPLGSAVAAQRGQPARDEPGQQGPRAGVVLYQRAPLGSGAGDDAQAERLAGKLVHNAPAVAPDAPTLPDPGERRRGLDPKPEPLDAGKHALNVKRALEGRCQEHGAATVPQGLAQSADGGGRDDVFPTGLHDMEGHVFPLAAQAATMLFLLVR